MTDLSIEDFKKIELRVAKILDVEEIPGADKIWKLTVSVGLEKKQLVAGVKSFYSKEELVGKSVIVVNNLAPATIRGVESRGMILAAKDGTSLTLITLDRPLAEGSLVS